MKFVKLTITSLVTSFALLTFGSAIAATCPSVAAIQAAGLSHAGTHDGAYVVTQYDNYGTYQTWGFGLNNVAASSFGDALTKGNDALASLSASQKSPQVVGAVVTVCFYNTAAGYPGTAITVENS